MTKYDPNTIQTPIDDALRDEVVVDLQSTVIDLIDLSLKTKQLHWNVVGPNFRSLHLLLDELVSGFRQYSDEVAERMTALGTPALGTASSVAEKSSLTDIPANWTDDTEVAQVLAAMVLDTAAAVRHRAGRVEQRDIVSHDLLVGLLERLEKNAWMLQAVTAKSDQANAASHRAIRANA